MILRSLVVAFSPSRSDQARPFHSRGIHLTTRPSGKIICSREKRFNRFVLQINKTVITCPLRQFCILLLVQGTILYLSNMYTLNKIDWELTVPLSRARFD